MRGSKDNKTRKFKIVLAFFIALIYNQFCVKKA